MSAVARKPASQITDRAKRYRANAPGNRPANPKQCGFCGSRKNIGVDHISGDEADGDPQNLMWACKSCNGRKANLMRKAGIGKLTRQYNPKGSKREQMKAYGDAIKVMRGQFDGDIGAAMSTIRSTPSSIRSAYTSRSWPVRKQMYGPSGRTENPMKKNPASLEKCVKAVSKKGGARSAYAVCKAQAKRKNAASIATFAKPIVHSVASNKAYAAIKKFLSKMNPSRRSNPASEAEAMFELFHGMPSEEVIEIIERVHVHTNLWTVGTLTMMKIETENGYTFDLIAPDPDRAKPADVVYVTANEKGNQLFFRGGDQEIPKSILSKARFKDDDFREHMVIGWVTELTYRTKKSFELDGKEQVDFYHALGKQGSGGALPMLVYKPRDPSMELFGGRYKVAPRRGDINASPGITG